MADLPFTMRVIPNTQGRLARCDSAAGRVGALLSRTSLSHFAARKGWAEVPCTRLDKGTAFLPASLRTRSVPIIPSLQAHDLEGGRRDQEEHPMLATKAAVSRSCSPSPPRETAVLANGIMPSGVRPPAVTDATLRSEQSPGSLETPIPRAGGLEDALKQQNPCSPMAASGSSRELPYSGTDTLTVVTVLDSGGETTQIRPRPVKTGSGARGLKAAGQGEAQRPCQGQTSLGNTGSKGTLTANSSISRVPGIARAKPSAS